MLFKIPFILAARIIICLGILLLGFHILVILEFIPYTIVWGSRLNSYEEMIQYEVVSMFTLLALIMLTWFKMKKKE